MANQLSYRVYCLANSAEGKRVAERWSKEDLLAIQKGTKQTCFSLEDALPSLPLQVVH